MKVKSSLLGMALAILPVFGFAGNRVEANAVEHSLGTVLLADSINETPVLAESEVRRIINAQRTECRYFAR